MEENYKGSEIDENLYNEKTLFLLNIRELRDIGRKFGVPSPTTMKKQELVDYILKIVYGEVQTETRSACGRPNVREFDIPTPIILKSHITNYVDFNNTTFLPRDFVESIDFDRFIIENAVITN